MAQQLAFNFLYNTPLFMVWTLGIFVALSYQARSRQASMLAAITFLAFLLKTAFFIFLTTWIVNLPVQYDTSAGNVGTYMVAVRITSVIFDAILFSVLLVAVFIGRKAPAAKSPPEGVIPGAKN